MPPGEPGHIFPSATTLQRLGNRRRRLPLDKHLPNDRRSKLQAVLDTLTPHPPSELIASLGVDNADQLWLVTPAVPPWALRLHANGFCGS